MVKNMSHVNRLFLFAGYDKNNIVNDALVYYVKTLSKWIYKWHHQNETTREFKFVEIKTKALKSVNEIKIHKSGMEIMVPANLEFIQMQNLFTVLAAL